MHAQSGSDDLAVLQLTKVVETTPNFVKAHLLLAVLYMAHEDYTKAGKSLYKVLKIDKNNAKAQWYMSIVKSKTCLLYTSRPRYETREMYQKTI